MRLPYVEAMLRYFRARMLIFWDVAKPDFDWNRLAVAKLYRDHARERYL